MNKGLAELMKWGDEQREEMVAQVQRLIMEDAPKNKFSVVTGSLRAIENMQQRITQLESEAS